MKSKSKGRTNQSKDLSPDLKIQLFRFYREFNLHLGRFSNCFFFAAKISEDLLRPPKSKTNLRKSDWTREYKKNLGAVLKKLNNRRILCFFICLFKINKNHLFSCKRIRKSGSKLHLQERILLFMRFQNGRVTKTNAKFLNP